ncbi:MAG: hypothetical protein ABH810_03585 [bacterium]
MDTKKETESDNKEDEHKCPNCGKYKLDYREECPHCNYIDKKAEGTKK